MGSPRGPRIPPRPGLGDPTAGGGGVEWESQTDQADPAPPPERFSMRSLAFALLLVVAGLSAAWLPAPPAPPGPPSGDPCRQALFEQLDAFHPATFTTCLTEGPGW